MKTALAWDTYAQPGIQVTSERSCQVGSPASKLCGRGQRQPVFSRIPLPLLSSSFHCLDRRTSAHLFVVTGVSWVPLRQPGCGTAPEAVRVRVWCCSPVWGCEGWQHLAFRSSSEARSRVVSAHTQSTSSSEERPMSVSFCWEVLLLCLILNQQVKSVHTVLQSRVETIEQGSGLSPHLCLMKPYRSSQLQHQRGATTNCCVTQSIRPNEQEQHTLCGLLTAKDPQLLTGFGKKKKALHIEIKALRRQSPSGRIKA